MTKFIVALAFIATVFAGIPAGAAEKPVKAAGCGGKPGYVTCEKWCQKWRGGSSECMTSHSGSCMNRYGSLKFCVRDGAPSSY
jgi:hypothetical protein